MPLGLPKSVTALVTESPTITRGLAAVKSAVDPLLSLCNSTFQLGGDGSLAFLRRIKSFAADSITAGVAKVTTLTATTLGATTVNAVQVNGTNALFGNQVAAATMSSTAGFKVVVDMGYFWASSAVASTRYRTVLYQQNDGATSTYKAPTCFQSPFNGSILGIQVFNLGSPGGTSYVQIFKNTQAITGTAIYDGPIGSAAVNTTSYVTFSKGTYPIVAGDYFVTSCSYTVAGNQSTLVKLIIELNA